LILQALQLYCRLTQQDCCVRQHQTRSVQGLLGLAMAYYGTD
jgi:hypothetical protein